MGSARSYLIVGASGAIGSAVAEQLAERGVNLGLHYCSNAKAVGRLKSRLDRRGSHCINLQSDLAGENDCEDLVRGFSDEFGAIDGIALCGGTVRWKPYQLLDTALWQQILFEHCIAPFTLARAAIPLMRKRAACGIVYLSSIAPKYGGSTKTIHYAAAKAALESSMRGLARELARNDIRVNGVRAGFVDTPLQRHGRTAAEIAARVRLIPLGRAGKPAEIASAITYLLSPQTAYVTGEIITIAGGD